MKPINTLTVNGERFRVKDPDSMDAPGTGENAAVFPGMTYKSGSDKTREEDKRYNEAFGESGLASGMGAVAYARASHASGYRTQTGYPPSPEEAERRPEATVKTDENGNAVYPGGSTGQGALAYGADCVAGENGTLSGGLRSKALVKQSTAIGKDNVVSGNAENSFIAGGNNNSINKSARNAFAAGGSNLVDALDAAAFNRHNHAGSIASSVFGEFNHTPTDPHCGVALTVVGKCNAYENGELDNALFAVGNGQLYWNDTETEANITQRSNALVVYENGTTDLKLSREALASLIRDFMTAYETAIAQKLWPINVDMVETGGAPAFTVTSSATNLPTLKGILEAADIHAFNQTVVLNMRDPSDGTVTTYLCPLVSECINVNGSAVSGTAIFACYAGNGLGLTVNVFDSVVRVTGEILGEI